MVVYRKSWGPKNMRFSQKCVYFRDFIPQSKIFFLPTVDLIFTLNNLITFTVFSGEPNRAQATVLIWSIILAFATVLTLVLTTRLQFLDTQIAFVFEKKHLEKKNLENTYHKLKLLPRCTFDSLCQSVDQIHTKAQSICHSSMPILRTNISCTIGICRRQATWPYPYNCLLWD